LCSTFYFISVNVYLMSNGFSFS